MVNIQYTTSKCSINEAADTHQVGSVHGLAHAPEVGCARARDREGVCDHGRAQEVHGGDEGPPVVRQSGHDGLRKPRRESAMMTVTVQ